ncbi:cytochrome c oxidase copper chaperone 1 [Manihot esculenta]|nr:cytochrome c oxidase copper chaperone 1 [Manihot esculenta]
MPSMMQIILSPSCSDIFWSFAAMGGLPLQNASSTFALPGSGQNKGSANSTSVPESKPKKKICCACPETKKLRDECIVEHGETACTKWIDAHRQCLRAEGFNV